jgi:hypothetical protein
MESVMNTQSKEYTKAVRDLNDQFRCDGVGQGSFMLTQGICEKGDAFVHHVVAAVRKFHTFTSGNDPYMTLARSSMKAKNCSLRSTITILASRLTHQTRLIGN